MLGFGEAKPVSSSARAVVKRSRDAVFSFVAADFFRNYQRWSPQVVELEPLSQGPVQAGLLARQVTMDQGIRSESTFQIAAYEPPSAIELMGVSEPFRSSYAFAAENDDQTEVVFTFELRELALPMRPFVKLIRAAIQDGAEQAVENIKQLIESETDSLGAARKKAAV